jgi:hypothetical protein
MRHRGTYIALRELRTGLLIPHYVEDVGGDRNNPRLSLTNVRTIDSLTKSVGDSDVVMERPTVCMVNQQCSRSRKLFAVWYESGAHRQIKRSLDFNLLSSTVIGRQALERFTTCNPDGSSNGNRLLAVEAFYNKEFPTYGQCFEAVSEGRYYSLAFSERFALCAHKDAGIVLYYKTQIVGYIGDTHPILLEQFQYLQEQLEESANGYV